MVHGGSLGREHAPPDETNLAAIAGEALATFGDRIAGAGGYCQYRDGDGWYLQADGDQGQRPVYGVSLLRTKDHVPVAYEVSMDERPVARVGLTRRELDQALNDSFLQEPMDSISNAK